MTVERFSRRMFLGGLGAALITAPAIVRAESIWIPPRKIIRADRDITCWKQIYCSQSTVSSQWVDDQRYLPALFEPSARIPMICRSIAQTAREAP